jgi:hypothetical protein
VASSATTARKINDATAARLRRTRFIASLQRLAAGVPFVSSAAPLPGGHVIAQRGGGAHFSSTRGSSQL